MLFLLLRQKKNAIKEDQYLRAYGIEPIQSTNPIAFFNRLKYHKMYYHFKPGKVYWIVFIIARKGFISTAGLLFRANPGFQLAFVLLVLFWAYVQQVTHMPFMSSVERTTVILEHNIKCKMGDALHMLLESRIAQARADEIKSKARRRNKKSRRQSLDSVLEHSNNRTKNEPTKLNYFWNYNTVERVLLSCLIVVCVCGVMFESDRFQDNHSRPSGDGFGAWVRFQQEFVTWMCILVIFGSMFFYFAVAYSEIFGRLPTWIKKIMCIKDKVNVHAEHDVFAEGDSTVVMQENPHMVAQRDRLAGEAATSELTAQLHAQQELARREKMQAQKMLQKAKISSKTRRRGKKKKKLKSREFGAVRTSIYKDTDIGLALEMQPMNELQLNPLKQHLEGLASAEKTNEAPKQKKDKKQRRLSSRELMNQGKEAAAATAASKKTHWKRHASVDGSSYFSNKGNPTETVWVLPEDGVELMGQGEEVAAASSASKKTHWKRHASVDGSSYFSNKGNPTETVWVLPKDGEVDEE